MLPLVSGRAPVVYREDSSYMFWVLRKGLFFLINRIPRIFPRSPYKAPHNKHTQPRKMGYPASHLWRKLSSPEKQSQLTSFLQSQPLGARKSVRLSPLVVDCLMRLIFFSRSQRYRTLSCERRRGVVAHSSPCTATCSAGSGRCRGTWQCMGLPATMRTW